MSKALLRQKIEQAEATVTKAQAAYDEANDREKAVSAQLLLADKKALEQLREEALMLGEEALIQLHATTGDSS